MLTLTAATTYLEDIPEELHRILVNVLRRRKFRENLCTVILVTRATALTRLGRAVITRRQQVDEHESFAR
jgi:hypothetical protein